MNLFKKLEQCYLQKQPIAYAFISSAYSCYDSFVIDDITLDEDGCITIYSENRQWFIKKPNLFKYCEESETYQYDEGNVTLFIEFF